MIERLGPDDGEITFQGTFSGGNAETRVQAFDNLRLSGATVWLTWETFRRQVVVKSFIAEYHSPWWIPYKISCVVTYQVGARTALISTIFAQISADLGNALAVTADSTVSLTALQATIVNPNITTVGTSDQAQAVAAAEAALILVNTQIATQSALVMAPVGSSGQPTVVGENLALLVIGAGALAAAVNTRSYVGRIKATLNGIGN